MIGIIQSRFKTNSFFQIILFNRREKVFTHYFYYFLTIFIFFRVFIYIGEQLLFCNRFHLVVLKV